MEREFVRQTTITREVATQILQAHESLADMEPLKEQGEIKHGDYGYRIGYPKDKRIFLLRNNKIQSFDLLDVKRRNTIDKPLSELTDEEFQKEVWALDCNFGHDVNLPYARKHYVICGHIELN